MPRCQSLLQTANTLADLKIVLVLIRVSHRPTEISSHTPPYDAFLRVIQSLRQLPLQICAADPE